MNISVVMPVYQPSGTLLEVILQAIQRQEFRGTWEVLIVDNEKTQNRTTKTLTEFHGFQYLHEAKPGSYMARNLGIRKSKGDLIVFIDADCTPCPGWLESLFNRASAQKDTVIAGKINIEADKKGFAQDFETIFSLNQERNVSKGFAITANLLIPRSIFERYGLFDTRMFSGGDAAFTQKLSESGVKILFEKNSIVRHPPRSTASIFAKTIRVTGAKYKRKKLDGKTFSLEDYSKCIASPLKAYLIDGSSDIKTRTKAFCFAVVVDCFRFILMIGYATGIITHQKRE